MFLQNMLMFSDSLTSGYSQNDAESLGRNRNPPPGGRNPAGSNRDGFFGDRISTTVCQISVTTGAVGIIWLAGSESDVKT